MKLHRYEMFLECYKCSRSSRVYDYLDEDRKHVYVGCASCSNGTWFSMNYMRDGGACTHYQPNILTLTLERKH